MYIKSISCNWLRTIIMLNQWIVRLRKIKMLLSLSIFFCFLLYLFHIILRAMKFNEISFDFASWHLAHIRTIIIHMRLKPFRVYFFDLAKVEWHKVLMRALKPHTHSHTYTMKKVLPRSNLRFLNFSEKKVFFFILLLISYIVWLRVFWSF